MLKVTPIPDMSAKYLQWHFGLLQLLIASFVSVFASAQKLVCFYVCQIGPVSHDMLRESIEVVHATEIVELIDVAPMAAIAVDQLDEQTTPLNVLPPTIVEDEEDPTVALAISYDAAVTQIRQMDMSYVPLVEKPDLSADSRVLKRKAIVLLLMDDTWVVVELYKHFPLVGWCVKMIPIGNYIRNVVLDEAEYGTIWILATRLNYK